MQLWFKHKSWYIKAFCLMRKDYRLFKISRIKNLSLSDSNFEVADFFELEIFKPNISVANALNKSGEFYHEENEEQSNIEIETETESVSEIKPPKNNVDLKLLIHSSYAHRVFDDFDEESVQTDENGNFIVNAIFPEDEWLYSHILSYNYGAEVLEPLYFRDKIIDRLQKTLLKYL